MAIDRDLFFGEFRSVLSHPLIRKCHHLKILGDNSYITTEDMEFILKNFDLKYEFLTRCLQKTMIDFKLLVNLPRLEFWKDSDLTLDHLKMMNCKTIRFGKNAIVPKQLNDYIFHWLAGNLSKLRRFQMKWWLDSIWMDDIFDGLLHSAWNPKRRARIFCDDLEEVDCSKGRDIERSDGLLATILIEPKVMYFLVWHERFPRNSSNTDN